jgi:LysM repeat protein
MSKETRIGLLVGLLFIIMFGLVLAGMLNPPNAGNAPPAGAVAMVNNSAAGSDGDREYGFIPTPPAMDSDRHPVPAPAPAAARPVSDGAATPATGAAAGSGLVEVSVARPEDGPMPGVATGTGMPATSAARPVEGERVTTGGGVSTVSLQGELSPLAHVPEEASGAIPRRGPEVAQGEEAAPAPTIYEVKQGDSLYKIAAQIWGPKNASKNSLILAANKDKIKNANSLKVGMKLVIPPLPGLPAAAPTATPTSGPSTPTPRSRHERSPSEVAAGPGAGGVPPLIAPRASETPAAPDTHVAAKTYTIKSGDTIGRVARTYKTSVDKILEMNKGVNPTKLKVGQKLTIPS